MTNRILDAIRMLEKGKHPDEYYQYITHARKSRNRYIKIHEGATYIEMET